MVSLAYRQPWRLVFTILFRLGFSFYSRNTKIANIYIDTEQDNTTHSLSVARQGRHKSWSRLAICSRDSDFRNDRVDNLLLNAHAACMPLQHCNRGLCSVLYCREMEGAKFTCVRMYACETTECVREQHIVSHAVCTLTQMDFAPPISLLHFYCSTVWSSLLQWNFCLEPRESSNSRSCDFWVATSRLPKKLELCNTKLSYSGDRFIILLYKKGKFGLLKWSYYVKFSGQKTG